MPFLWSESYFYRKLLDAVGYFTSGPWAGIDPFAPTKTSELTSPQLAADLAAIDELDDLSTDERAHALLLGAVWGNQADLGFRLQAGSDDLGMRHLIHDDSPAAWQHLRTQPAGRIILITDNAGRELLADLILIDYLLHTGWASHVSIHVKPYPYYVSDATTADLLDCLHRMAASDGHAHTAAARLTHAIRNGRLTIDTHRFYCQPWSFHYMPKDLADPLGTARLVIAKGDLNYRRLVGDLNWPPTASFTDETAYFPASILTLRTLKSDAVIGLDEQTVTDLDATGQQWRTTGTYALTQARLRSRSIH